MATYHIIRGDRSGVFCTICGVDFVGPVILAGVSGEDLADWPASWQDTKRDFSALWA